MMCFRSNCISSDGKHRKFRSCRAVIIKKKEKTGLYHPFSPGISQCLLIPHGHDDVQEAIGCFQRNGADDIIDLQEHLVIGKMFEGIQQVMRIEGSRHGFAIVFHRNGFAAFANVAVRFKTKLIICECRPKNYTVSSRNSSLYRRRSSR